MGAVDSHGNNIRRFSHVKVTARDHGRFGDTGTVVEIRGDRLHVAFPGGAVLRFRSSSIAVITSSPRFRESG